MNVALCDVDGHHFPNLALMKLSAWHKAQGDTVEWYELLLSNPERIYASKVFTFSPDAEFAPCHPEPIRGGTGYRMYQDLPPEIDSMLPDYSIYPQYKFAIGFLSRGCIRNCPWCVVPRKEGKIRQYDDVERLAQDRKWLVLMDNNFLANDFEFVKEQLEKVQRNGYKIDFNQGLDARLVTPKNAELLAKCKYFTVSGNNRYIRFSCDTLAMVKPLQNAILTLRKAGYNGDFFVYILAQDLNETVERINSICQIDNKIHLFVQPYRNLDGDGRVANPVLRDLARWCNMAAIRKSCTWEEYKHKLKEVEK